MSAPAPGAGPAAGTPGARTAGAETRALVVAFAVGSLFAVALGVYGRLHEPTSVALNIAGFSSGLAAKAWITTAAFLLALVQLASALVMYGRIPVRAPSWIGALHRWSGRAAVLVTVPVAVHCLYALGFQAGEPRALLHSFFGCFFYGAFAAKMLALQADRTPGWALPVLGGAVLSAVTALWLTASYWFFTTFGLVF